MILVKSHLHDFQIDNQYNDSKYMSSKWMILVKLQKQIVGNIALTV